MISGDFGPNSKDPRVRRAFAYTQLHNLRAGTISLSEAHEAVNAASQTRKGRESNFTSALLHIALGEAATSLDTVFVSWSDVGGPYSRPRGEFGGYLMSAAEAHIWEERRKVALGGGDHTPYNQIHAMSYPKATLSITDDHAGDFQWAQGYDLYANPANARLEYISSFAATETAPKQ